MIYLEITKSSDPLLLGLYEFEFDQISIGRSKRNDLVFLDKELPIVFMHLKIIQEHLVVKSLKRSPFFFINGKKISGTLKLKLNDLIAFGDNEIRILKYGMTNQPNDFSSDFEEFNQKTPELKFVLDFIEEVLIDLEKKKEEHV
jgi:pSer/pThr/pTyr-binding forkhead associated (FHA) protein